MRTIKELEKECVSYALFMESWDCRFTEEEKSKLNKKYKVFRK